jgi:hypothetical protein
MFDPDGNFLAAWGTPGIGPGEFSGPTAIAVDCLGDIYVADTNNNRVQRFDPLDPQPAPGGCQSAADWPPPLDVPPVLHVSLMRSAGVLAHRAVALSISCQRGCRVRISATLAPRGHKHGVKLKSLTRVLPASVPGHLSLALGARIVARLRRALGHKRLLSIQMKILAVGPTGRQTTLIERYLLTR